MPPDVFLVLASSGLTLVASMMFFVSDDVVRDEPHDPRADVAFCVPPTRHQPPPLPRPRSHDASVRVDTHSLRGVMTLRPAGDEWEITLDTAPVSDAPAMQVSGSAGELRGQGSVNDLRWHQRAGLGRPLRHVWKQKPGRA